MFCMCVRRDFCMSRARSFACTVSLGVGGGMGAATARAVSSFVVWQQRREGDDQHVGACPRLFTVSAKSPPAEPLTRPGLASRRISARELRPTKRLRKSIESGLQKSIKDFKALEDKPPHPFVVPSPSRRRVGW